MSSGKFDVRRQKGVSIEAVLAGSMLGCVILTVVSGLGLVASRTYAEEDAIIADAAVTVASSCRMGAVVNSAHEADVTASTYKADIGKTTISVACNDSNGFAVYAVGYTNEEFGRNEMLGVGTGRAIATGTATVGGASNWAMKLTAVDSAVAPLIVNGYDTYHAVPSDYQKVASYSDSTMSVQTGSQFETTYAVYTASLQAADTYRGKVKYTMMHPVDQVIAPCTATYSIDYSSNGGSGTMEGQTACNGVPVTIPSNVFTAPAPIAETQFAVWNTAADGSGYTYLPGQSVANLADAGGSVTLYAQWAPKYIQDLTAETCRIVTPISPLTVYDRRDENDYTVRYLQGACWMTRNLRIKGSIRSDYSNFSTYDTVNVCEGDLTSGSSYDEARCHELNTKEEGAWYNYAAASAKTILTNNNKTEATEDICPAGWHLPSYNTSGSVGSINSMAGVYETVVNAFSPVVGYYSSGSISTSYGFWWSSGASGSYQNTGRRFLVYINKGLDISITGYTGSRGNGYFIRCVRTE